jgi:hypothetical protein
MNREETLALWEQGREKWNAWADDMIVKRTAIKKADIGRLDIKTDAIAVWMADAAVEFSTHAGPHTFASAVDFSDWIFPGDAWFDKATFNGTASFADATFMGNANFVESEFKVDARFKNAIFKAGAWFEKAVLAGREGFDSATFMLEAGFLRARFTEDAGFTEATFTGDAIFVEAFFDGKANFEEATFEASAGFEAAIFDGNAEFGGAMFKKDAGFAEARFKSHAAFDEATFDGTASYTDADFRSTVSFQAVRSERSFTLERAIFHDLPDFIQAHFSEAPRVDNSHFRRALVRPRTLRLQLVALANGELQDRETYPARYRALKRLAIQGHDHESEMQFYAREITSARGVTDFPVPWRFWNAENWSNTLRWWFGWSYQLVSDFGRSLVRPLALWMLTIVLATCYFLGQTPSSVGERNAAISAGAPADLVTFGTYSMLAWSRNQPCFTGLPDKNEKGDLLVTGLAAPVRAQTTAALEAIHLSFRNAFIALDGGSDAAHRTFGCLFGIEKYGDNPVAIVPSAVTFASMLQKAFSGILIFLFGLAVRNMLRMK